MKKKNVFAKKYYFFVNITVKAKADKIKNKLGLIFLQTFWL